MEEIVACNLDKLEIILLQDTKNSCNFVDPEKYFLQELKEFLNRHRLSGTVIMLSDEYCYPFKQGKNPASSAIYKFISKQNLPTYFLCGQMLFGRKISTSISKLGNLSRGDGNIGFRICSTIDDYPPIVPLQEISYYFVSAARVGNIQTIPGKTVMYINDIFNGIRRLTSSDDSGWLSPNEEMLSKFDTPNLRHYLLRI